MATQTPKAELKSTAPAYRAPSIGQQVRFVILKANVPTGEQEPVVLLPVEHIAFVERVHKDTEDHLIDLSYFTRDSRGSAFASTVPYDASGEKSHSWSFRGEGK